MHDETSKQARVPAPTATHYDNVRLAKQLWSFYFSILYFQDLESLCAEYASQTKAQFCTLHIAQGGRPDGIMHNPRDAFLV
jgi:hypothetical protein